MNTKLALTTLILAALVGNVCAKDLPAAAKPAPQAREALIDAYLHAGPPPAPPGLVDNVQPYKHEWNDHGHDATTPIPEPETYALLLAGLGVLAAVRMRSKSLGD